jgi:hypothetical protein
MSTSVSVIIAGALVAVAVLITGHWQIEVAPGAVYRLDRWTGDVAACNVLDHERGNVAMFQAGSNIPCVRP